jgi:uncharacterized Zn-binding protein involved in type VI secretion
MPGVARKDGTDSVDSPDGTGYNCASPTIQATDGGSLDVFVNGIGVVRENDPMTPHAAPGCSTHAPTLSTFSPTVFVNGLRIGRLGDAYDGDHIITSASTDVIVN